MGFMSIRMWIQGARPKTLPLGLSPVLIGIAASWRWASLDDLDECPPGMGRLMTHWPYPYEWKGCGLAMRWFCVVAMLCIVVAVGLQITVNYLNDYADGMRGADAARTSDNAGPQRLVASGVNPKQVMVAASIAALTACVAGLAVVIITECWWFIALGLLCLLAAWGYTNGKHPYGYQGFGEAASFVFFGPVPVLGTQIALCNTVTVMGVIGGIIAGLFSVGVMMVNNLRDAQADASHGKRTLIVRIGVPQGRRWYCRAIGLATVLTAVCAMPSSVYLWILDQLVALPAEVDAKCECSEYGINCPTWGTTDWLSLLLSVAALAGIVLCVVLVVRSKNAVRQEQWRQALPLCSMSSLAAACAFVGNALQASTLGGLPFVWLG